VRKWSGVILLAILSIGCASSLALATTAEGKYKYVEKNHQGTLIIERIGPGYRFKFNTTDKGNGQMCDFATMETPMDEGGGRVNDALPAHGGTKDDGIKFNITFSGNTANVDVESKGDQCGRSGYFGGRYEKVSP
jgi:hypothetical protein